MNDYADSRFFPNNSRLLNSNTGRKSSPYNRSSFSSGDYFGFGNNNNNNTHLGGGNVSSGGLDGGTDYSSITGYLGTGASIISDLAGAYGALKQANLAEDGLNFAVDSFNQKTGFKIADYNRRIVDQQNARINSTSPGGGGYASLANFKDANLLQAKPISV